MPIVVPGAVTVAQVATGAAHSCARIQEGGRVLCWGDGRAGQLGDGERQARPWAVDTQIEQAASVAAGTAHTCALLRGGRVWCWGRGTDGQLGTGDLGDHEKPTPVAGITDAVQIAAGGAHTCAVRMSGELRCWGANTSGQLGAGLGAARGGTEPPVVASSRRFTNVSAGGAHTCAITDDNAVLCWGANTSGQLGDRAVLSRPRPRPLFLTCP